MKKNTPKRRRICTPQFSQPSAFITATGYGKTRNYLDTTKDSGQVCSDNQTTERRLKRNRRNSDGAPELKIYRYFKKENI